jgi:NADH-quinone oxidoreductase subunit J
MTIQLLLFIILALVAIASALGMLFSRNAVYSTLYLILNFATVAVFYLLLNAPFLAVAQVSVYAGAIMVLFLFVIMLLGAEQTGRGPVSGAAAAPSIPWQRPFAIALGLILLVEAAIIVLNPSIRAGLQPAAGLAALPASFGSPNAVGTTLFTQYLLPFEITSILLLVAMIGAIVLTRRAENARGEKKE